MTSSATGISPFESRRRRPAPIYQAGQCVWLLAKDLHLQTASRKLASRYVGSYQIEHHQPVRGTSSPATLSQHPSCVHHVSQVKPVVVSALSPLVAAPPPPCVLQDGDPVWAVRKLLAVRRRGRGFQYLVDWEGYGPVDRSWVPPSYLANPALLVDFYREHPDALGRSPGGSHGEL